MPWILSPAVPAVALDAFANDDGLVDVLPDGRTGTVDAVVGGSIDARTARDPYDRVDLTLFPDVRYTLEGVFGPARVLPASIQLVRKSDGVVVLSYAYAPLDEVADFRSPVFDVATQTDFALIVAADASVPLDTRYGDYEVRWQADAVVTSVFSIVPQGADQAEGTSAFGQTPFRFLVARAGFTLDAATVTWRGVNGTTDGSDFATGLPPSGTLVFAPGEVLKSLTVEIAQDDDIEGDETFRIELVSVPDGNVIGPLGSAEGRVRNDDEASVFSVTAVDAVVPEGSSGLPTPVGFTIARTGDVRTPAIIDWAVTGGDMSAIDFGTAVLPTGRISFAAGEATRTIVVNVTGDTALERHEVFGVEISLPPGAEHAVIGAATATVTVANDDAPPRGAAPAIDTSSDFLFDPVYYLWANPELVPTVPLADALTHYLETGAAGGRAPTAWFDASYYAQRWDDLADLGLDDAMLFAHFNRFGVWEGRAPGPLFDGFDGARYLDDNPDVAAYVDAFVDDFLGNRVNGAIAHFIIYGAAEGRVAYDTAGVGIDLDYLA